MYEWKSKGPDDTLRMRMMIWMHILRMLEGTFFFAWRDPNGGYNHGVTKLGKVGLMKTSTTFAI